MPIVDCPDCGKQISTAAPACPGCGCPMISAPPAAAPDRSGKKCAQCGAFGVGRVRGLQGGGEILTFLLLFFVFVIPALLYYMWMESVPFCSGCGRRA